MSKKVILIVVIAVAFALIAGGAGAYFLLNSGGNKKKSKEDSHEHEKELPPVFLRLEQPVIVNLVGEDYGRYLQTELTFKVDGLEKADYLKTIMPMVKNKVIFILSAKKPDDLDHLEDKIAVAKELRDGINSLAEDRFPKQQVIKETMFTSFVIQ